MSLPPLRRTRVDSPVGPITLVASDAGLRAVLFEVEAVPAGAVEVALDDDPVLAAAADQLRAWFAGERTAFDLRLDVSAATAFQRRAWLALAEIPYGTTRSYGEQARLLGVPRAARAVGAANGRNPLSIVLPCHRLVGANGALTGFSGGLDVKRALLDHEAATSAAHAGAAGTSRTRTSRGRRPRT
jgi:methylated-DNA-[protein]-cysteine S-methyltransferase